MTRDITYGKAEGIEYTFGTLHDIKVKGTIYKNAFCLGDNKGDLIGGPYFITTKKTKLNLVQGKLTEKGLECKFVGGKMKKPDADFANFLLRKRN